jgi:hypothetical protein
MGNTAAGKNGLRRYTEDRDGRMYVYESTSRMENGKKITKTTYIGRQDPATGEILEKKPRKTKAERETSGKTIARPGIIRSREFGSVHFLNGIKEQTGMGEDMIKSFGRFGETVMALAFAQAISPGAFMDTEHTFGRTVIGEMFGLGGDISSPRVSELTRNIGESTDCIDMFFGLRLGRSGDTVAWDTTSDGTHSERTGLAEWGPGKDGDGLMQVKIGLATDLRGVPILFDMFPGSIPDSVLTKRFVASVCGRGKDCLFVMDNGFESAGNTVSLLDDNVRFVMPADTAPKAVKKLLTEFPGHPDVRDKVHNNHAYRVWETELAIVPDPKRRTADGGPAYTYLSGYDEGFDACRTRVRAFVCYDSKKYSDETQRLRVWLDSVEKELCGKEFRRPEDKFFETAGKAARYFDAEYEGRTIHLQRKNNALAFADNRAGTFVMLSSPGISWDVMMDAYDARCLTEQAFDVYKNDLDGRRLRTGDRTSARGRFFVKFLALIMRCEMTARMREMNLKNRTAGGILNSMGNIMAVRCGDVRCITEISKTNRELYALFGIAVPTDRDITHI